ncbi:hypothetical protein WV31_10955 [Magnetospirillum sp. ME-1]|uniref:hypothetical protein n=1 Tax=Magnetospirillum sp. ME-1 TaxID=1639348 RepID=UPI000A17F317|nr:hypothetical protein [Magnetospirillum sp. ME-1]ARJ66145.1 hypothetical protein WV31_10955 [Magnetospirillum sp. ME-1]
MEAFPDLIDAHLSLGRLAERLSDPAVHSLWLADAIRREAMASMLLDGRLVTIEDIAMGRVRRWSGLDPSVERALSIIAACDCLCGRSPLPVEPPKEKRDKRLKPPIAGFLGMPDPDDEGIYAGRGDGDDEEDAEPLYPDDEVEEERAPSSILSAEEAIRAARAEIAGGHAALAGAMAEPASRSPSSPPLPSPLSHDWLMLAWRRLNGPADAEDEVRIMEAGTIIDAALQRPGLIGVASALHGLLRPDLWPEIEAPELPALDKPSKDARRAKARGCPKKSMRLQEERQRQADALRAAVAEGHAGICPAMAFIRMIVPWIIARACGLRHPGPWISGAVQRFGRRDWQEAGTVGHDAFVRRLCRILADGFDAERARLDELERLLVAWERRMRHGRARRAGKSLEVLRMLIEQPAHDTSSFERCRGLKTRMAQVALHDLGRCGVLYEGTGTYSERIWLANGLR